MLFTEPIFLVFFLATFAVYWTLPRNRPRKAFLLLASCVFYAAWDWRFLFLIFVSTIVDFIAGHRLGHGTVVARKRWLVLSLVANLGILGFFKYFNFFVTSATGLLQALGLDPGERTLEIVLPVGISFFTFQSMSYTIDIYRGRMKPVSDVLDFALFVGFFPQLVAGPIVRARLFLPQLRLLRKFADVDVRGALTLFLIGFIKKACIADNVAPIVDRVFENPGDFDALSVWIGVLFYAVQIYCDFSGYTDMAIAVARLLGYELTINFRLPYLAASLTDFWHRWHISLSTWLRDYLYIPLGGNRGSRFVAHRNVLLTMLLGGLWHGAAWTFVVWGALHGVALVAHKEWSRLTERSAGIRAAMRWLGRPLTFYWVCVAWIFFRAQGFDDALAGVRAFVLFSADGTESVEPWLIAWMIPLALAEVAGSRRWLEYAVVRLPGWGFAAAYGAAVAVVLPFVPLGRTPFVYFQF